MFADSDFEELTMSFSYGDDFDDDYDEDFDDDFDDYEDDDEALDEFDDDADLYYDDVFKEEEDVDEPYDDVEEEDGYGSYRDRFQDEEQLQAIQINQFISTIKKSTNQKGHVFI